MISDVFSGKKVIEQVIETDSSVVKGIVAAQAPGAAEPMRGKVELSPFGSSISPVGLSSPLVKWWWCTQPGSGQDAYTIDWEALFGWYQPATEALTRKDICEFLLQFWHCNDRSSSYFSPSEDFCSCITLPMGIPKLVGFCRVLGDTIGRARCYCDLQKAYEELSPNWHSCAFKYCLKICEP